jgi:hypothetical protein
VNTTRYFQTTHDQAIMRSHCEVYKGWKICVEISGDSLTGLNNGAGRYIPRIVATEQLSIGFRELEVPADRVYSSPEHCLRGGVIAARAFIDRRW